jgi:long-chain acyl-CoA synthetase
MADLGFWAIAQEDPDHLALVEPDGTDVTAGDLLGRTGTTGRPKGVRRPLSGAAPEAAALGFGGILLLFGIQPHDGNVHLVGSPLCHTAVLTFSGGSMHLGHTLS